ncbi:MAG: hypothetical protein IJC77_00790 [Bacteroidaceae bacterium]|nr:hypothetical protein [Bacteroidaceae bacterium]
MYKIYIYRKEDLNDATSFYVDIIISALKKNSIASEIVYAITNISKDDKVIVITLPAFVSVWKHNPKQDITMWFQGIVPEECAMMYSGIKKYWKILYNSLLELFVLHRANRLFFVSGAMKRHYNRKYRYAKDNYVIMPCFNQELHESAFSDEKYCLPSFVYAGSLAEWQCVEETLSLFAQISKVIPNSTLTLLTGEKSKALDLLKKYEIKGAEVKYVPYQELNAELAKYKYGFLIRENIKVNNVATPTKMNSYMSCGIIPVYSNVIGDFKDIFKDLKFKIEVTSFENAVEQLQQIESSKINKDTIMSEYRMLFSNYYSVSYYTESIKNIFQL